MIDQEKIHAQCLSEDLEERKHALEELKNFFSSMPDKQQAWNDLIKLTNNEDSNVRYRAAEALVSAFSHVPDKQQAWNNLLRLTNDEDRFIRSRVAFALGSAFSQVPDKQKGWNDLLRLTNNEDRSVRYRIAFVLVSAFSQMPDKQQAWNDLIKLTNNEDRYLRSNAAYALCSAFFQMPDKQQAWNDLIKLTNNEDSNVSSGAALALESSFPQVPDKREVWNKLLRLTNDEDSDVRSRAAKALGSAFSHVLDKQQAWNALHRLTSDEGIIVRSRAALALGSAFPQVPDKQQAWSDLQRLINDEDKYVRSRAVSSLGSAFSHVPDKQQAWNDLHRLINDEDNDMRSRAALALGSAFPQVPDKQQAWNDLQRLTNDEDKYVRASANHSLGRISIFMASQSETDEVYKRELEKAIEFFEKAVQESTWYLNPSEFCLPFYRSFHAIVFKKKEAKEEVDRYLEESKAAIEGSESKKQLFEAVKSLSEALKEVYNLENLDLKAMKDELNFYRKYCDNAAELMNNTDEKVPYATGVIRKGLPILDRNLKRLLVEIQEKAKTACRESQETNAKEIACDINKEVQEWEIGSPEEMVQKIEHLALILTAKILDLPQNKPILEKIEKLKAERNIVKQYEQLAAIIVLIPTTYMTVNITDNKDTNISIGSINQSHKVATNSTIPFNEQNKSLIGIITALPKEYAAVKAVYGNLGKDISIPGDGAGRIYCLLENNSLNGNKSRLVLANAGMGTNRAATRATLLLEHFPGLKYIIMVGIAGGVPNPKKVGDHVRLGDIVVSDEKGVIQYDFIKTENEGKIENRHPPRPPSAKLLEIARLLESNEILGKKPWIKYIDLGLFSLGICRPPEESDKLYKYYTSSKRYRKINHPEDHKRIKDQTRVFFGPIGSADILQKNLNMRDKLRNDFGIKAIEMEASGIADATWNHEAGYLIVRGICDYCDSHKNDDWHQYAAVVAAAYIRALIESIP